MAKLSDHSIPHPLYLCAGFESQLTDGRNCA